MSEIREMQLHIVAMMKKVDALLTENKIPYTLLGGSVLGAVRHKGFIPWDDDMDIGILRRDFSRAETLLAHMQGYVYEFAEKHIVPDAPIGHLHLINEQYPIENAPTLDVFALDNVPASKIGRKKLRRLANLHHLSVLRCAPKNRGLVNRFILSCALHIVPQRVWNVIQKRTLHAIIALHEKDMSCIGNIFGAWTEREYFAVSVYTETTLAEFEGLRLPVPKNTDLYLSQLYGNYMELPPAEKRLPKHRVF